jgi:prepilin-type N-terminal cleavage/methylation domain-containing protein/prepilin-type processing-associated H-X9-DG protein
MKRSTETKSGFSLIELLCVIAVILILLAILFPVFQSIRESGRIATCLSNERQIALAINGYSQDYDNFLPQSTETSQPGVFGRTGWQFALDPYTGVGIPQGSITNPGTLALQFYKCPDFEVSWIGQDNEARMTSSYVANRYLMPSNGVYNADIPTSYFSVAAGSYYIAPSVSVSSIGLPAQQVEFAEAEGVRYDTDGNDAENHDGIDDGSPTEAPLTSYQDVELWESNAAYILGRSRHNGGSNYIFADGHVKWFKAPATSYTDQSTGSSGTCDPNENARGADAIDGPTPPLINPETPDPCVDLNPIESRIGIVYSHSQFPDAAGFFTEN